jgi:hypothetical protein
VSICSLYPAYILSICSAFHFQLWFPVHCSVPLTGCILSDAFADPAGSIATILPIRVGDFTICFLFIELQSEPTSLHRCNPIRMKDLSGEA